MNIGELLPLLIPFIVIEFGMRIYAIVIIVNSEKNEVRLRYDSKVLWALVAGVINFGWVVFFLFGRVEE